MSNESTNIIETMSAELERLRPMEASLEMAEADVKAYKQRIAVLEKEIAELKSEIRRKEAVEQRWFEQCMEARSEAIRLKRALWLARAYRSRDNSILLPSKFMRNVWDNVERKCRVKAEEYK